MSNRAFMEETEMKELTAEQIEKLRSGKLEAVSGGAEKECPNRFQCPKCGSEDVWYHDWGGYVECACNKCGYEWYYPYA